MIMPERKITISATTARQAPLQISDWQGNKGTTAIENANLITQVIPGDIIKWISNGDISEIVAITSKSPQNKFDIFDIGPKKESDGTWIARVSKNARLDSIEAYNISYTVEGQSISTPFIEDPKIQVKPTI